MRRSCALVLAVLLGLNVLPVRAGEQPTGLPDRDRTQPFQQTVRVELQGQLQQVVRVKEIYLPFDTWYLTISGQTYWLYFGAHKDLEGEAARLVGKTVRVTGTLDTRLLRGQPGRPDLEGNLGRFIGSEPRRREFVQVATLEAVANDSVQKAISVEIHGKVQSRMELCCPPDVVPVVHANGQVLILDFGKNAELARLANELDGKTVMLTGVCSGSRRLAACTPDSPAFLVVQVTDLKVHLVR